MDNESLQGLKTDTGPCDHLWILTPLSNCAGLFLCLKIGKNLLALFYLS